MQQNQAMHLLVGLPMELLLSFASTLPEMATILLENKRRVGKGKVHPFGDCMMLSVVVTNAVWIAR